MIGYGLDPPFAHDLGDGGGAGQIKPRVYFGVVCGLRLVTVLALAFNNLFRTDRSISLPPSVP